MTIRLGFPNTRSLGSSLSLARRGVLSREGLVPRDGPDGWLVPESSDHFSAAGLVAPNFLFSCSEASGNLTNSIGSSLTLSTNGSGHLYRQPMDGWNRPFIGLDGITSGQSWRTTSSLLDLTAGQSIAMLCYASMVIQPTGASSMSRLMGFAGTDGLAFVNSNGDFPGGLRPIINGGSSIVDPNHHGFVDESGIASVRQFVLYRNATTDRSGAFSNRGSSLTTHNETARTGQTKGIGSFDTSAPPNCRIGILMIFLGTRAEQDWPTYLSRLRGG